MKENKFISKLVEEDGNLIMLLPKDLMKSLYSDDCMGYVWEKFDDHFKVSPIKNVLKEKN